ncbi:hypothetical protein BGZ59_002334 [Podila verticillata]|nr:hypothetical protein BGZ59_002334 [Podila verticillata]KAI9237313.1 MAG: hypothetical protein BYD32DRAFT_416777 [Podila humilis]KFH74252.1 hypothetical protein MVEG_01465 [Podila verticillata NRRL 6337]
MYFSKTISTFAVATVLAMVAQASPVAIPVYEKGVDAEYTEPKEEANAPALEKRGFGCPDSQSCANYCLSIGRNGGYCGGFLWHTCYCNQS